MMAVIGCLVVLVVGVWLALAGCTVVRFCVATGSGKADFILGACFIAAGAGCIYASYAMSPFEFVARVA